MEVQARLTGVAASEGVAIGPVFVHNPGEFEVRRQTIAEGTAQAEIERFEAAVRAVVPKLSQTAHKLRDAGFYVAWADSKEAVDDILDHAELYALRLFNERHPL